MRPAGQLMGGTFDLVPNGGSRTQYAACSWKGSGDTAGTCTLLGPEGPDALRSTDREQTNLRAFLGCPCGKRGRYRPYFENYTVDASIF
jgi:hypothetical protein